MICVLPATILLGLKNILQNQINKMKITIRKWFIFTEFGMDAIPYILDASHLDVSDNELAWCIQEQIYGDKNGTTM